MATGGSSGDTERVLCVFHGCLSPRRFAVRDRLGPICSRQQNCYGQRVELCEDCEISASLGDTPYTQDFRTAEFFKGYVNDRFKVDGTLTGKQLLEHSDRSWVSTKWDEGNGAGDTGYTRSEIWEDEKDDDEDDDGIYLRKHRLDHPWVMNVL